MINIKNYIVGDNISGLLKVKVTPGAKKSEAFSILGDNTIKIRIKAPAEKGKANKELIKFLSKELEILKDKIEITAGASDQIKIIRIKY